jgi:hemerythrin-like domain-containing protein
MDAERRRFLTTTTVLGAATLLGACTKKEPPQAEAAKLTNAASPDAKKKNEKDEDEVGPNEDLMREHGVLRRILVVYRESATRLRAKKDVPPDALQRAAKLFKSFGEDYHEKKVEEPYVFAAVKKAGGPAAAIVDVLVRQHDRGRQITDWLVAKTAGAKIGASAEHVAGVLESFARMYEEHAAREDTIVFPAFKASMPHDDFEKLGDKFEDIEKQTFGKDGFDDAVKQMSEIEGALGLSDLGMFDAPPPPT